MLFASWLNEQIGTGFGWTVIFLAVVIYYARKFLADNPKVKDAAKEAAASKAIELIGKLLGKK